MKKMRLHLIVSIVSMILFSSGCGTNRIQQERTMFLNQIKVPSLKHLYPVLYDEAKKWNVNAELESAILELTPGGDLQKRTVSAFFLAPKNKDDFLFIEYFDGGILQGRVEQFGVPISEFKPIKLDDWEIDSDQAWDIFIQHPEIQSSKTEQLECISMMLVWRSGEQEDRLVWRLSFGDCNRTSLVQISIDANTGKLIDVEKH